MGQDMLTKEGQRGERHLETDAPTGKGRCGHGEKGGPHTGPCTPGEMV